MAGPDFATSTAGVAGIVTVAVASGVVNVRFCPPCVNGKLARARFTMLPASTSACVGVVVAEQVNDPPGFSVAGCAQTTPVTRASEIVTGCAGNRICVLPLFVTVNV